MTRPKRFDYQVAENNASLCSLAVCAEILAGIVPGYFVNDD